MHRQHLAFLVDDLVRGLSIVKSQPIGEPTMTPSTPSESKGSPTYFAPVFVSAIMGPASYREASQPGFSQAATISVSPVSGPEQS